MPGIEAILDRPERLDPDRLALVFPERTVTYAELGRASRRCGSRLAGIGAPPGSVVPVVDGATLLSVSSVLGLAGIGCAAALVNPRSTAAEIAALVESCSGASLTIAGAGSREAASQALGGRPLSERDLLDEPRASGEEPERVPHRSAAGWSADRSGDEVGLVLFTSGTTGLPKPVLLSQRALLDRIAAFAQRFDASAPPTVSIMCVPMVHIGGMLGLLVNLAGGGTTVVEPRFDAGEWLELVESHRVRRAFLVPTMLRRILDHPSFGRTDLSSLEAISYGAAPASPELVARAVEAFPAVSFSNVFGQTETLGAITSLGPEDHRAAVAAKERDGARLRLDSVGRPLPGVRVRIVEPESGSEVEPGAVGELWASAPYSPGWTRTGDLVRQGQDGYLYVAGRLGDTINRGGEKISPLEVEAVLRSHPLVTDAAVAGVPDEEMGARVGAAVVSGGVLDPGELRDFCRRRLAGFKVPERIVLCEGIPYTETGKVSRRALSELISGAGDGGEDVKG